MDRGKFASSWSSRAAKVNRHWTPVSRLADLASFKRGNDVCRRNRHQTGAPCHIPRNCLPYLLTLCSRMVRGTIRILLLVTGSTEAYTRHRPVAFRMSSTVTRQGLYVDRDMMLVNSVYHLKDALAAILISHFHDHIFCFQNRTQCVRGHSLGYGRRLGGYRT
jgi:hypothetical protein